MSSFFEQLASRVKDIVPSLLLAISVVIAGYLLGLLIRRLSKRAILFLDQLINERVSVRSLKVDLRSSSGFIARAFFWIILSASLLMALRILRLDVSSSWLESLILYLPNVIAAVVIIFVGIISGRLIGDLIGSSSTLTGINNAKNLGKAVRFIVVFVAIIIAVDQLGIHVQFLTTLIAITVGLLLFGASLAFGLGAKTSVSNILGAYYARKSFQPGDKIQVGDVTGVIVKITDHAVTLEYKSDLIVIPAKEFNESKVIIYKA